MYTALGNLSRLVTARPWITIALLLLVTVALAYGAGFRAPPTEGASLAFLPPDHPLVQASEDVEEHFGDSGEVLAGTLIFRGETLTPDSLAQMDALASDIASDPLVRDVLTPTDSIIVPSSFVKAILQVDDLGAVTQAQIDAARDVPGIGEALSAMTGVDKDGTEIAIGNIRLINTADDSASKAEFRIDELANESEGPFGISFLSPAIIQEEYEKATEEGMAPLILLALVLIPALIFVFTRSIADTFLSLTGLVLSITWVVGAEGWLGPESPLPEALRIIGPPSSLTTLIPVIIISLTVDYALQTISHYREQRLEGLPVREAVRAGMRNVTIPLTLAAVTTMAGMLASLFSPIAVIGDFGVVAAMGVGLSLIVMLTLIPAGRTIIDRRRESRGSLPPTRAISNAVPGVSRIAEILGREVTRRPAPYIVGVLAVTVVMGYFATGLKSEFSIRDVLPNDGSVLENLETLDAAVGGSTELASLLVTAEITDSRTLLNLHDLTNPFEDERTRPSSAAEPVQKSFEDIVHDWTNDSGEPGDNYDAELAALFERASPGVELDPVLMQEFVDELLIREPELSQFIVNNPDGMDLLLLQFLVFNEDQPRLGRLQAELEELWLGEDDNIIVTSLAIVSVAVGDQITSRQTEAIGTTAAVAVTILAIFFWLTLRQPALAVIAVGPIVLVLICVLGTMRLLDIPYSLITSIITALSIGIGVDYTIHIIHRYREEYSQLRNPEQAAIRTLSTTGSALLGSAMTTGMGFGVLIAAPLTASQQFGITATITIVYSLIVSVLLVLPAMVVWGAYQNVRLRSTAQRWAEELDLEIDAVHRRHEAEA